MGNLIHLSSLPADRFSIILYYLKGWNMKIRLIIKLIASDFCALIFLFSLVFLASCDEEDDPESFRDVPPDTFWEVATPASQQMDETALQELASIVGKLDGVYSFLIVRNGKIVHEQYHNGAKQTSLLHTRSITKRITGTLVGIGIDNGNIAGQNAHIFNFFPEITNQGSGQGWDQVTVYHLLNMVSGMDWVENDDLDEYENNLNDPLKFIFGKDIVHEPETYYSYNTPGIHLLSHIVERTSADGVTDFAEKNLFDPLGIPGYEWEEDGGGVKRGGAGLELTARDQAKIGLLYLQNGEWQGQQIVSEEWIDQCFNQAISLDIIDGDHLQGISIGQTWWTRDVAGERIHYGDGYGGQILLLVPEHEIVIVMNRAYKVDAGRNNAAFESFFTQVFPAVLDSVL